MVLIRKHTWLVAALLAAVVAGGCENQSNRPDSWRDVSVDEAPEILEVRRGHPALTDLRDLYLGQPKNEARDILETLCGDALLRRDDGAVGGKAYFLGCRLGEDRHVQFVRAGFWPRLRNRVATLEVKRSTIAPGAVLAAAQSHFQPPPDDRVLTDRIIQLEYPDYRFFADWDQGLDGPTHLTVGFDPQIPPERAVPED